MAEDRDGYVRLPPDQFAALERAMREGPMRVPSGAPSDIPTGLDASHIRKAVINIIDDELSRRRVLSDGDIRDIAKDVAHSIFTQAIRPVEDDIRKFLTEDEIEAIVVEKLREVGLRADKEHIDDTRQAVEGVLRGHRRRYEIGTDFLREVVKAFATLFVGALISGFVTYAALKGGSH